MVGELGHLTPRLGFLGQSFIDSELLSFKPSVCFFHSLKILCYRNLHVSITMTILSTSYNSIVIILMFIIYYVLALFFYYLIL